MASIARFEPHTAPRGQQWRWKMTRVAVGSAISFIQTTALQFGGDECLYWPFAKYPNGYGHIWDKGRNVPSHRLVCMMAHGEPPTQKHEAAHNCGNGHMGCCNPNHLRWATREENEYDKLVHGTDIRGSKHPNSKLSYHDVAVIKGLGPNISSTKLSRMFGVCRKSIHSIQTGKNWGWL